MAKATGDSLENLHGAMAALFEKAIEHYKDRPEDIPASLMSTIRQFLKDNHIESVPTPGSPLAGLVDEFPFEDEVSNKH